MCLTKYYYLEHETAYRRIEGEHKANWDALHEGSTSFDDFASRAFLTQALANASIRPVPTYWNTAAAQGQEHASSPRAASTLMPST